MGQCDCWRRGRLFPDAKRGDSVAGAEPDETPEQSAAGLVWWPCSFCNRFVLVDAWPKLHGRRERCACGARRIISRETEGWTRGGKTWWFI